MKGCTVNLYKRLLTPSALSALEALRAENDTTGTTPDDDLDVLAGLVVASRSTRILQFGSFLGGSAVVLIDLAAQIDADNARLVTLDPNPAMNASTRKYCALAGHEKRVETIDGYSTDEAILRRLRGQEWDVIYLDTTHQYWQTLEEIDAISRLCSPRTLFVLHDASRFAAETLDMDRLGGVRRAMYEFCVTNPRWHYYIFEQPAFGQYGIGLMQKREIV